MAIENRQKVLCVELLKASHGLLKSALKFYVKVAKDLESLGFELNPCDECIASKIVNGNQQTVAWHVDDLKVSHADPEANNELIEKLRLLHDSGEGKMKVIRGKAHEHLGIEFDYRTKGEAKINIMQCLKKMLKDFPEETMKTSSTPAQAWLFKVREDDAHILLTQEKAESFHTQVAKLLFACKRARPDMQTVVAFLTTRVKQPDEEDWKKLMRVMECIKGSIGLVLTLSAKQNEMKILDWHVDRAHQSHQDLRGCTGAVMTLGKGGDCNGSTKQKMSTRSSTETELVGSYDMLPQAMWTKKILGAQGMNLKTRLHRDSKSCMLLEQNGMNSSSKRTNHVNARCFYIKDVLKNQDVDFSLKHCPTDDMIGCYFYKTTTRLEIFQIQKIDNGRSRNEANDMNKNNERTNFLKKLEIAGVC